MKFWIYFEKKSVEFNGNNKSNGSLYKDLSTFLIISHCSFLRMRNV